MSRIDHIDMKRDYIFFAISLAVSIFSVVLFLLGFPFLLLFLFCPPIILFRHESKPEEYSYCSVCDLVLPAEFDSCPYCGNPVKKIRKS